MQTGANTSTGYSESVQRLAGLVKSLRDSFGPAAEESFVLDPLKINAKRGELVHTFLEVRRELNAGTGVIPRQVSENVDRLNSQMESWAKALDAHGKLSDGSSALPGTPDFVSNVSVLNAALREVSGSDIFRGSLIQTKFGQMSHDLSRFISIRDMLDGSASTGAAGALDLKDESAVKASFADRLALSSSVTAGTKWHLYGITNPDDLVDPTPDDIERIQEGLSLRWSYCTDLYGAASELGLLEDKSAETRIIGVTIDKKPVLSDPEIEAFKEELGLILEASRQIEERFGIAVQAGSILNENLTMCERAQTDRLQFCKAEEDKGELQKAAVEPISKDIHSTYDDLILDFKIERAPDGSQKSYAFLKEERRQLNVQRVNAGKPELACEPLGAMLVGLQESGVKLLDAYSRIRTELAGADRHSLLSNLETNPIESRRSAFETFSRISGDVRSTVSANLGALSDRFSDDKILRQLRDEYRRIPESLNGAKVPLVGNVLVVGALMLPSIATALFETKVDPIMLTGAAMFASAVSWLGSKLYFNERRTKNLHDAGAQLSGFMGKLTVTGLGFGAWTMAKAAPALAESDYLAYMLKQSSILPSAGMMPHKLACWAVGLTIGYVAHQGIKLFNAMRVQKHLEKTLR